MDPFLESLASRTPTPGGGAAAAATGAVACALGEMVAAYSIRPGADDPTRRAVEDIRLGLHNCRVLLRRLTEEDAAAYQALTDARAEARNDPSTSGALDGAVLAATSVPLEIAAAAVTALSLMNELSARANRRLLSDLGAAAVLSLAAARAAEFFVRINLPSLPEGSPARSGLGQELEHVMAHGRRLAAQIEAALATGLPAAGSSHAP